MSNHTLFITTCTATVLVSKPLAHAGINKLQFDQIKDVPIWPFIFAAIVGLFFLVQSVRHYLKSRKPSSRVFPKLTLRRRLYAPYSGGNSAAVSFGSDSDA